MPALGIASDFVLIVIAGLCGGLLARVLRLPLLVGYVAAGVAVGPYTAGPTVVQTRDIELLAEIGVALLLFALGLEISLRDLRGVRRIALIGGPIQILVTMAAGVALGRLSFGMSLTEAVWLGAIISLSSTMVVLKTLSGTGLASTLSTHVMIGLLVVQDLAVVPMLIVLPQLGALESTVPRVLRAVAIAAVFLILIVLVGTRLLPGLLKWVLRWGSRELFLVSVVAVGVGVGYATHMVELSFALGAFVAGLVLSESEFSHQALSDVVPLRDIFGLLFFVAVGMLFDPRYVLAHPLQLTLLVILVFLGKALIVGGLTRAFGYRHMAPWVVGLGLSQIGEFSFVLARAGLNNGALSKDTYDLVLACTILTMAFSPVVSNAAQPLGRVWARWRKPVAPAQAAGLPEAPLQDHAIVAGYGRSGRAVARVLRGAGVPLVVVEADHAVFNDLRSEGFPAIWGDIAREEILHAAGVENARVLVLAVPDRNTVQLSVERAQRLNPALVMVARAVRERHVQELRRLGVSAAIQPEFEAGVEMARQTLVRFQFDDAEALRLVSAPRAEMYGESA
jgi:CPA2 family monovalent cation:H+ antiporter-2